MIPSYSGPSAHKGNGGANFPIPPTFAVVCAGLDPNIVLSIPTVRLLKPSESAVEGDSLVIRASVPPQTYVD